MTYALVVYLSLIDDGYSHTAGYIDDRHAQQRHAAYHTTQVLKHKNTHNDLKISYNNKASGLEL